MKKSAVGIEMYRRRHLVLGDSVPGEMWGYFEVECRSFLLRVIASDGLGWDHVSVSLPNRTPNWGEMCFVKNLWFEPEETVVQFHPADSAYINNCPTCLHLWRKQGTTYELPPELLVGIKE